MVSPALDVARYARNSEAAVGVLEKALAAENTNSHNHHHQHQQQPPRTNIRQLSPQQDISTELERDIRTGLGSRPLSIPSKYHYDKDGSVLFEDITRLPEYYLTRVETEILTQRAQDIMQLVVPDELVELGSGSSTKTRLLLEAMHCTGGNRYVAIEISETALCQAAEALSADYKWLEVDGYVGNYHTDLPRLQWRGRRLLTFLGSSLGNYLPGSRHEFLKLMGDVLKPGDALLLGVDLVKDEKTLVSAYDDTMGVTARFNLNVLEMLNRELDADFQVENFVHTACWNQERSGVESYLVAQRDMTVSIRALDMKIAFAEGEKIQTEISCKFTREGITQELDEVGLKVEQWYTDKAARYGLLVACPK